ncbi:protein TIFY 4B-like isoform X2 [Salvia miltiorrhiza]|uniref:protein TIFY 4B-like isoform X2 n=1 Tax=Salvia miltiorrhiza TaxID=226208 RepID=UPI0025AC63D4|nr:protein TIFY 4B-like isoform X2 [Salvia miltiorrhiza]
MPESCAAPPEETAVKSPLDKPLHQLTEDDIAQVTREDCRRYLKEKGMRRPSWNKSQAIQQVIMLKTLLETTPDSDAAGARKRLRISRPTDSSSNVALESVPRSTTGDAENSLSAEETTPHSVKDLDKPDSSGGFSSRFAAANDESAQPRTPGSMNMPIGQMTIFYCGKVNVYDDIPADKVRALMHIAASPLQFPDEQPVDGAAGMQPLPCIPKTVSSARQDSAVLILPTLPTVKMNESTPLPGEENKMLREETPVEGPSTRKASVLRYLEKRKDRFKSKGKAGITSCASLDVYINHQMGNQLPRIDTSITQIRKPSNPTRCSSMENDSVKKVCLSTGLSNKGV